MSRLAFPVLWFRFQFPHTRHGWSMINDHWSVTDHGPQWFSLVHALRMPQDHGLFYCSKISLLLGWVWGYHGSLVHITALLSYWHLSDSLPQCCRYVPLVLVYTSLDVAKISLKMREQSIIHTYDPWWICVTVDYDVNVHQNKAKEMTNDVL